jgi:glutaredoxin
MAGLIIVPIQASATSESMWDDAREGVQGGTIGGLSLSLSESSTEYSAQIGMSLPGPPVIEVYTATWCTNCVTTEHALDEAIGDTDVVRIHYHRHKFEAEDPFGSNGTEERWESIYGAVSTTIGGAPRLAPTTVFDGERFHLGTSSKSDSLLNDYTASLGAGSTHEFGGTMELWVATSGATTEFSWDLSGMYHYSCGETEWRSVVDCPFVSLTAWLLFVEDSANFPEGSNEAGDYLHVLHEAVQLDGLNGSTAIDVPTAWDGNDLSAILLVDWEVESDILVVDDGYVIPAPGVATLLCMLAALVPRRRSPIPR